MRRATWLWTVLMLMLTAAAAHGEWQPKQAPLMTRWARDVSPEKVHPEYPRPQMVRERWRNLNGLWSYAVRPAAEQQPDKFDGEILVPFPIESALSGVMKRVKADEKLWYRRTFTIPEEWKDQRVLLHCGAVDWEAAVWVNGKQVGNHRGGYDPFTLDITDALKRSGPEEIVVGVHDPTSQSYQPRGKQIDNPHGIWYTPTTGIWQTVWLEPVPQTYIERLTITPDLDKNEVRVAVHTGGAKKQYGISAATRKQSPSLMTETRDGGATLVFRGAEAWTPDNPRLYEFQVSLTDEQDRPVDTVSSYFAQRKISLGKDEKGILRVMLNDKPLFQYGLLDQGFWPDGLYTAPTDEALRYDIEVTKELGYNLARKHVKVEPDRWYYWCDKLGLIVWQDMPSGDRSIRDKQPDIQRSPESAEEFEAEWKAIIDALRNHPSIVMWVPFNEGWGQFDTARITDLTKQYDPTRLVDSTSGWTDRGTGDVHDIHVYPGPASPKPEEHRAAILGEFGGLGLPIRGHTWQDEKNWGYRNFTSQEALTEAYLNLVGQLRPLIGSPGLSAAIYTQTTDVEIEVNGILTYDRALIKMPPEKLKAAHAKLHLPPPTVKTVLPTAEKEAATWRYTESKPADEWFQPEFDDSAWKQGPAGFGQRETPGAVVRTEWKSPDIWLRRTFELSDTRLSDPHLRLHHDEDCEIHINGVLAAKVPGYTTEYQLAPISDAAKKALRKGTNTLAIHCHQTGGGQYIDAGLVDLVEQR